MTGEHVDTPRPPGGTRSAGATPSTRGTLGERIGPIVAGVGVLGAVAVLAWVVLAPDNVVARAGQDGVTIPAQVVLPPSEQGECAVVVAGDAAEQELCIDAVAPWDTPGWTADGTIVLSTEVDVASDGDGRVEVDPATGQVVGTGADVGEIADPGFAGTGADRPRARIDDDDRRVRRWVDGRAGPVVLDLGSPVARPEEAAISPDGRWVVARDSSDRLVVAEAERPDRLIEWTDVDEGGWVDLDRAVRWTP